MNDVMIFVGIILAAMAICSRLGETNDAIKALTYAVNNQGACCQEAP